MEHVAKHHRGSFTTRGHLDEWADRNI